MKPREVFFFNGLINLNASMIDLYIEKLYKLKVYKGYSDGL